jgi:hypothetical protein
MLQVFESHWSWISPSKVTFIMGVVGVRAAARQHLLRGSGDRSVLLSALHRDGTSQEKLST